MSMKWVTVLLFLWSVAAQAANTDLGTMDVHATVDGYVEIWEESSSESDSWWGVQSTENEAYLVVMHGDMERILMLPRYGLRSSKPQVLWAIQITRQGATTYALDSEASPGSLVTTVLSVPHWGTFHPFDAVATPIDVLSTSHTKQPVIDNADDEADHDYYDQFEEPACVGITCLLKYEEEQ